MAKKKSPLYRRQIHVRRTRKLQQKNQNLTGKAVGAIGQTIGKAIDDYKKPKEAKKEAPNKIPPKKELDKAFKLDTSKLDDGLSTEPSKLPEISKVNPRPPAQDPAPVPDPSPVVMPNTGIGGTEWTPGQEHTYPEGPRMEDDAWLHPGGGNQGPLVDPAQTQSSGSMDWYNPQHPGSGNIVTAQGKDFQKVQHRSLWGDLKSWGESLFDRKPGMVKEYYKNNHRTNPYGRSPLKRTDEYTPAASGIEGGTQYVDQIQRAAAPSYLGDIGAAAAEGYNIAVDRHNYKQRVWAEKQRDLEDAYGKLQVEPTGQTAWDAHAQNMGKEWVNEFTELYNNRDSYDPAEYSAKLADIKQRAGQFQSASNNLKNLVANYDENLDNVSASTPPETIDILETLRKNTGTLIPQNVDGVPTLVGQTIGGQDVSVPISEIANGKNLWRFNTKVAIQPKLDKLTEDLGKFRTQVAQNGGLTTQSIGWDQLQGRAQTHIQSILQNPSEAQAIAAERYGIDHDDWTDMEQSGMDPMAELQKRMLQDVQQQFQPYEQIQQHASDPRIGHQIRQQQVDIARQREERLNQPKAPAASERIKTLVSENPITTEAGLKKINDTLASSGKRVVNHPEAGWIIVKGNKAIGRIDPNDPTALYSHLGVKPQDQVDSPVNRSPFRRMMDFFLGK